MSTIVTRAGKGSPLTWNEVDNNFTNLNTDKLQSGNTAAALTITSATINGGTITGTALNGTLGATTPSTAVVTSLTSSSLTSGRVTFASTGGLLSDTGNLAWDNTNSSLLVRGVGVLGQTQAVQATGSYLAYSDNQGFRLLNTAQNGGGLIYVKTGVAGGIAISSDAGPTIFETNATERMRIDYAGNVGIGVTPSAWDTTSLVKAIQLPSGALWNFSTSNIYIGQNYFWNGTNRIYSTTEAATEFQQGTGSFRWYTVASGTAGTSIVFGNPKMILDASGNLGVGTNAPNKKLELKTDTTTAGSEASILIHNYTSGTTSYYVGGLFGAGYRDVRFPAYIAGIDFYRTSTAGGLASLGDIRFYASGAGGTQAELRASDEKMRITNQGNIALAGASTSATGVGITFPATQSASTDANCLDDYEEGTWNITCNTESGTAYTITSRNARYTKIGNIVTIQATFAYSAKGSGQLAFIDLPISASTASGNSPRLYGHCTGASSANNQTDTAYPHYSSGIYQYVRYSAIDTYYFTTVNGAALPSTGNFTIYGSYIAA